MYVVLIAGLNRMTITEDTCKLQRDLIKTTSTNITCVPQTNLKTDTSERLGLQSQKPVKF